MLAINRHKRHLPSVPSETLPNRLQLRRANSDSRYTLPATPLNPSQNLDDECDLLEIDLNDPVGSMNRTLRSKTDPNLEVRTDKIQSRVKQIRDQTTNTPPMSSYKTSIKSRKNSSLSRKTHSPPVLKLQKVGLPGDMLIINISDSSRAPVLKLPTRFR